MRVVAVERRPRTGSARSAAPATGPPPGAAVSFGVPGRRPASRRILLSVALAAELTFRATLGRRRPPLGSWQPPFTDDLRGRPMISHSIAPFVVDVMATLRLRRDGPQHSA
jgi:hypothetical protein